MKLFLLISDPIARNVKSEETRKYTFDYIESNKRNIHKKKTVRSQTYKQLFQQKMNTDCK